MRHFQLLSGPGSPSCSVQSLSLQDSVWGLGGKGAETKAAVVYDCREEQGPVMCFAQETKEKRGKIDNSFYTRNN